MGVCKVNRQGSGGQKFLAGIYILQGSHIKLCSPPGHLIIMAGPLLSVARWQTLIEPVTIQAVYGIRESETKRAVLGRSEATAPMQFCDGCSLTIIKCLCSVY